ncbi:unnamed protein product [Musa hybrid cultivar]
MAACGSLSSLFEKPRPENPTLMESLSSWSQIMAKKPVDNACSFTEIFGELHFQEKPAPPPDSNHGFPLKSSDKLQLCTERLGSESSDDVDDLVEEDGDDRGSDRWKEKQAVVGGGHPNNCSDVRTRTGGFPPPISSIGKSGKPWIYFKSYRHEGRFVLREIRIPTKEFLHASREDGRLKLQLVHPDEEIPEGDEEEDDDDDDDEEEEEEEEDGEEAEEEEEEEEEEKTKAIQGNAFFKDLLLEADKLACPGALLPEASMSTTFRVCQ